ncbi:hypothetical protein MVEN_01955500 [Mycena venus]|uniref:Uncharacterized protein n=1 Tax=Mycena venus TaxID=2733690 RepID=A0A8H7CLH7_9AGAR|nr:hypothetical protein MVEN_01955500 [Mycena venus]
MAPRQSKGRTYECHCALCPEEHLVPVAQRNQHNKLLADSRTAGTLADDVSSKFDASTLEDTLKIADMMTALALTDSGSNVYEQPSKLFASRASFQKDRALHQPTSFTPVSVAEATRSVNAVLDNPKKVDKCQERSLRVLAEVKQQVEDARTSLDIEPSFSLNDLEHVAQMRSKVTTASGIASLAEKTLKHVRDGEEKEDVIGRLRALDLKITYLGAVLPEETTPFQYDASYIAQSPIKNLDMIAQVMILLGIVCHVIIGLGTDPTNFVLQTVTLLIKMVMSLHAKKNSDGTETYDAQQIDILEQLPSSLHVALNRFNIDGKTLQYAVCPDCHHTHAPQNPKAAVLMYPKTCVNSVVDIKSGRKTCGTELLIMQDCRLRPIKPFLCPSFMDHLAQVLSDPEIERLCDQACDDAFAVLHQPSPSALHTTNVFKASFLKDFEGPIPGQLFIDRRDGKRLRLAYVIFLDFFNPNGTRKRSNHDFVGLISAINVGLPLSLRNKPEYTYVCLLSGRREPSVEQINGYLRIIIDEALIAWEHGIHLSSTGTSPEHGRNVDLAFILSINNLPAARKIAGAASHNSHFFCMVCSCYGISTMYRTDFDHPDWKPRSVDELRRAAEAWRDANTVKEREEIFKKYGVCWLEMWRLPYWNPSQMLVINAMHCVLEGTVHYHCRCVLEIDETAASKTPKVAPAFDYEWRPYNAEDIPSSFRIHSEKDHKQVTSIRSFICTPLSAQMLYKWRLTQPLVSSSFTFRPKTVTLEGLRFIQEVIAKTVTPSWINSVPKNYGESNAGTIKAVEWRLLATIYIPIALVLIL